MIIYINAAGCPNACRHCSANGHPPYGGFYTSNELKEIASEWGTIWPHYEVTAHPEFPAIMDPQIIGEGSCAFPPTNGYGLAERDDYKEVFARLRYLGCRGISFTLHGLEEKHDWFVCRKEAFQTILKAGRRAADFGFAIHWNIFLDRCNSVDIPPLMELGKREFGLKSFTVGFADPNVSLRSWQYEKIRPRLGDVKELLQGLNPDSWTGWLKYQRLEDITESALLCKWEQDPDSKMLQSPWESPTWPPSPPFDNVVLRIDRNRQVFYDPACGELMRLGSLADGKDKILRRLQNAPEPPYRNISAAQARQFLPESDADLLHGEIGSVRLTAIAAAIFGLNSK